jgi:hypothetical protein
MFFDAFCVYEVRNEMKFLLFNIVYELINIDTQRYMNKYFINITIIVSFININGKLLLMR